MSAKERLNAYLLQLDAAAARLQRDVAAAAMSATATAAADDNETCDAASTAPSTPTCADMLLAAIENTPPDLSLEPLRVRDDEPASFEDLPGELRNEVYKLSGCGRFCEQPVDATTHAHCTVPGDYTPLDHYRVHGCPDRSSCPLAEWNEFEAWKPAAILINPIREGRMKNSLGIEFLEDPILLVKDTTNYYDRSRYPCIRRVKFNPYAHSHAHGSINEPRIRKQPQGDPADGRQTAITLVSRKIREETLSIFYGNHPFILCMTSVPPFTIPTKPNKRRCGVCGKNGRHSDANCSDNPDGKNFGKTHQQLDKEAKKPETVVDGIRRKKRCDQTNYDREALNWLDSIGKDNAGRIKELHIVYGCHRVLRYILSKFLLELKARGLRTNPPKDDVFRDFKGVTYVDASTSPELGVVKLTRLPIDHVRDGDVHHAVMHARGLLYPEWEENQRAFYLP